MVNKSEIIKCGVGLAASLAFVFAANGLRTLIPEVVTQEAVQAASAGNSEITAVTVEAPKATSADGVISAEDWKELLPNEYNSLMKNKDNELITSYIEEDPYITDLYEGYGFAIDYGSARGHYYDLEDVGATERPHAKANCLTCKTPNFTKLVNDEGVSAYTMDFQEVYDNLNEGISCYNCHENQAGNNGELVVTHNYISAALGDNMKDIDPAILACGQCHIEYYFKPESLEATMPHDSIDTMGPEATLEYYKKIDFADWTQESNGTRMLKAQHPEMETYLLGKHAKMGLTCADCHMATETAEDGTVYKSHYLESPLNNETLLNTCATCHGDTDMTAFVQGIQENVKARESEVGTKLQSLKKALDEAVADGKMSEDELNKVRELYRDGEWFWDYCYVENAEGAHNSELAYNCLDTAEKKADEALGLLNA